MGNKEKQNFHHDDCPAAGSFLRECVCNKNFAPTKTHKKNHKTAQKKNRTHNLPTIYPDGDIVFPDELDVYSYDAITIIDEDTDEILAYEQVWDSDDYMD